VKVEGKGGLCGKGGEEREGLVGDGGECGVGGSRGGRKGGGVVRGEGKG